MAANSSLPTNVLAEQASQPSSPVAGQIAAGGYHTCALLSGGDVRCWGFGGYGALGYGNVEAVGDDEAPSSAGPVQLGAGRTAKAIAAGYKHTCALLDDATVRCWGDPEYGQLGHASDVRIGTSVVPAQWAPVDLGRGRTAKAITAGDFHTCALLDDDTVRCWGHGAYGRTGHGNEEITGISEKPGSVAPVDLGPGRTAKAIAAGGAHTCVLLDEGSVRCFGSGMFGALGYASTNDVGDDESPGSIGPVDLGAGRTAKAIAAGAFHTCAVLDEGSVRCWGVGANGALGSGNTESVGDDESPGSVAPVDIGPSRTAKAITAGGSSFRNSTDGHTCAVLDDNSVRCWGEGRLGQLGYGSAQTIGDDESPSAAGPVDLGVRRSARAVTAGAYHSCAVLDDDTVRCWGLGAHGRLGYANTDTIDRPDIVGPVDITTPTAIDDTLTIQRNGAERIIDVLANDVDPDGGEKLIDWASEAEHGSVSVSAGGDSLTYKPDPRYCNARPDAASDSFTYALNGGSQARVSVTVTCDEEPPLAPAVATGGGWALSATTAAVTGTASNPHSGPAAIRFEFGTTSAYGRASPAQQVGGLARARPVGALLSGLRPATTYHYRLVASNADGAVRGADRTFRTLPTRPARNLPTCMGEPATIVARSGQRTVRGTSRRDVIVGSAAAQRIAGRGGADRICAAGGRDRVVGGPGEDRLSGGAGGDLIDGGSGGDIVDCGLGRDRVRVDRLDRHRRCERVERVGRLR